MKYLSSMSLNNIIIRLGGDPNPEQDLERARAERNESSAAATVRGSPCLICSHIITPFVTKESRRTSNEDENAHRY